MRYLITLVVILVLCPVMAQETLPPPGKQKDSAQYRKQNIRQSLAKGISEPVNKIEEYKIISYTRDTTFLDTTLTIQKEYTYNYLRRDDFELMPFANVGQPYNSLGVDLTRPNLYPKSGARARHFNYLEKEDITYYNVPTPMTDLFFKTTLEQGQLLDAMITFNTSPRFNFSIAYKGFRSLGKYQFNQVESGNFRTTANYQSKNNQYTLRAHIAGQDILGEENGGLIVKELQFESEDPEFRDRSRIDVFFTDARNKVLGKRYFLDHRYVLTRKKDSVSDSSLGIGHEFTYETKYYQFQQDAQNKYFGEDLFSPIDDKAYLKTFFNSVSLDYSNRFLGTVKGYVNWFQYDYFFDSLLITEEGTIPNQLKGNEIAVGGSYKKRIGPFSLDGNLAYGITGELTNYIFDASAKLKLNEENEVSFSAHASSRKPNFNFLLYQSDYANYNWYNAETFEDENVQRLQFDLNSQVWGDLTAQYTVTDNYTYFSSNANAAQVAEGEANAFVTPKQEGNSVNLLKVKYRKEFRLGKWALNNTVMYQNVTQDSQVLNLPQLVTRNTIYFSSDVFKKAMFLQTGVTFKYFTAYNMDAYNPLLGEFYVQNQEELGGFPLLDFFINARVRQTRIYLKAEHFNSSFTGNTFYAAPGYPYRDFVIRFGLVWNFFS
ncbi:putative porin [Muriicola sp.]|uniref:putative porin n=1 Tax=Muriicola sp. TaxID=2020856 RepID=UPI003569DC39